MGGDANKRFEMLFEVEQPPPPEPPEPDPENTLLRVGTPGLFPDPPEAFIVEGNLSVEGSLLLAGSHVPNSFSIDGGGNPVYVENSPEVRVENLQSVLQFPSTDVIEIGQAVTLNSTGSAVRCYGPMDYNQGQPLGVCVGIHEGMVSIACQGRVQHSGWVFTPGEPIFVAIDGGLTNVPPNYGYVCQVGMAIEAETVVLNLPVSFITGVR